MCFQSHVGELDLGRLFCRHTQADYISEYVSLRVAHVCVANVKIVIAEVT